MNVNTKLDGFNLANHRQFTKFVKVFRCTVCKEMQSITFGIDGKFIESQHCSLVMWFNNGYTGDTRD